MRLLISDSKSSTCVPTGRTSISGSNSPVGLTTCSIVCEALSSSYFAGVADTKIIRGVRASHSSNFKGLLSKAEGNLNP